MRPDQIIDREEEKDEQEVFTAALRCADAAEREALLDRECGVGTPLRKMVESLLEEVSGMGDFLERSAVSDTRITVCEPGVSTPRFQGENPGDQLGNYQLIDLIGEGGGGSVYLAEQAEPQRQVALKILKLGMDTKSVIARFEAERQTLALMEHPNIAKVFDAGATKEGRPYFVMEYVSGTPLTDYCDAHALTVDERIKIFIKVCHAVEHAHRKGIIHRDLKPSNILVSDRDGEAVPKIIDFGVAKAIDPASVKNGALTLIETIIGTPAYMSPEQADRECLDIDTRSDVYSLGVLLHELLTSYTAVAGKGTGATGLAEVRRSFREGMLARPSARVQASPPEDRSAIETNRSTTIERLSASLRGDLDWVVMKCLERDRNRRFGSASDLARDLECYLEGAPVAARPPSVSYRFGKFVRRHRGVVAASGLFLLTLITVAAVSVALAIRARQAEQYARESEKSQSRLFGVAVRDQQRALKSAASAHLHEYVADINLSYHAVSEGLYTNALKLLDRHLTKRPGWEDLRGFEWRYLVGRCLGDQHKTLPRHQGPIRTLAFSPNGNLLAIGTGDSTLLWNLPEDRQLFELPGGHGRVAFFPDGQRFAIAGREGVAIYELDSASPLRTIGDQGGDLALSDDGALLATSGRGGVAIWRTETWSRVRFLPGSQGPLVFSPDGETLATGSWDGITLWSLHDSGARVVLEDSPASMRGRAPGGDSLTFSPDGKFIVTAQNFKPTAKGYIMGVWETKSGQEVSLLPGNPSDRGHGGIISSASFDGDGSLLATSSWDHSLRLWDFSSRSLVRTLHGHRSEVWCVALSPDGRMVASGSKDGEVKIWPTEQEAGRDTIEGKWKPLQFSEDGSHLAALDREGTIAIFHMGTREIVQSYSRSASSWRFARSNLSLSADMKVVAEEQAGGTVRIRRLGEERGQTVRAGTRRIDVLVLAPHADTMIIGNGRGELAWWDLKKPGKAIATMAGSQALFSADGTTLVTVTRGGHSRIWDVATRTERARIAPGREAPGSRLALSRDGSVIAMTYGFDDFENKIGLWETATGKLLGTLNGHMQGIWSLAFSPDGRTIASSSGGGTLRLWNVESRRELLTIREPGTNVTDLLFSPDGQYLVGSSPSFVAQGKMRIFQAPAAGAVMQGPESTGEAARGLDLD